MTIRPTNKLVSQFSTDIARDETTRTNNEKVQRLMRLNHSCLSCNYFPTSCNPGAIVYCRHPKRVPKNKAVKHYNICHLHSAIRLDDKES